MEVSSLFPKDLRPQEEREEAKQVRQMWEVLID